MAIFREEVCVEMLMPLTNMPRVDSWRTIYRFVLTGATKHGSCNLLLFNTHQPNSEQRKFNLTQQINMCKAVINEGVRFVSEDPHMNIGFGFGGDANCPVSPWTTAFNEDAAVRLTFKDIQFLWRFRRKAKGHMVGCGTLGLLFLENTCKVEGQEKQHDPMVTQWC